MATAALTATRAAGLKPSVVYVPRPSATPDQLAQARESGVVQPLYTGNPAPMGLAYYGLSSGGGGSVVGTVFNTTGVEAVVDANGTGIQANDLYQTSPDSFGVQLNAVLTNVTLFGTPGYQFWTQNVVTYYPATQFMVLVTNIWNFSGLPISANALYSHGPSGTNIYGALGYYYAQLFVPFPVAYPFNLTLTLNSSISAGRDNVSFNVSLNSTAHPAENFSIPFDWADFNSLGISTPALTMPSNFTADGLHYNPIGLTNDFELDVCGPGGGSQADLTTADATLGLGYWNGLTYVAVPAAYSYGGETGETSTGANVAWGAGPGGPPGLLEYGTMTTGPSLLTGLWGTGAPVGSFPVTLSVSPPNAFNFLEYQGAPGFSSGNFIVFEQAYAPNVFTDTFYLMPGTYDLLTELSDYQPFSQVLTVAGPMTVPVTLVSNPGMGVYTPLWAFSNAEVSEFALSGSGTPAAPYIIDNHQTTPFSSLFGLYNDFTFPVFPGVWFMDTSASTELLRPASLSASTNDFQFPGANLPATNDLQYWFWDASNVSVVDAANISGWFGQSTWYPTVFDSFNMIFYESSHNLVAGNTFDTESQALIAFSGGTLFGPLNVGGGNNTIWGNTFNEVPGPACQSYPSCESLLNPALGLGMEIAESYDTIYNNYVATPTTAWLLPLNLYSGTAEYFTHDLWNIAPQPASNVNHAAGFPTIPLTGSIAGTPMQGGNFWWDYGMTFNPYNGADNPYGVLPYDENASTLLVDVYGPSYYYATYIYPGGDFAPLVPLYSVTFSETGLPVGTHWSVTLNGTPFSTTGTAIVFHAPNGTFAYSIADVPGWHQTTLAYHGTVTVNGSSVTEPTLVFHQVTYSLLFLELAPYLPHGKSWSVAVDGSFQSTTGTSLSFTVPNGTFPWLISGPSGYRVSTAHGPGGPIVISGSPPTQDVSFARGSTPTLTFHEVGLASGTPWCVTIGAKFCTTASSLHFKNLTPGTYSYAIGSFGGMTTLVKVGSSWLVQSSGTVTVSGSVTIQVRFAYPVTFTESGLTGSFSWSVSAEGLTGTSSTHTIVLNLTNGSQAFSVHPVSGYTRSPASGHVTVAGGPASQAVVFTPRGHLPARPAAPAVVAVRDMTRAIEVARAG